MIQFAKIERSMLRQRLEILTTSIAIANLDDAEVPMSKGKRKIAGGYCLHYKFPCVNP